MFLSVDCFIPRSFPPSAGSRAGFRLRNVRVTLIPSTGQQVSSVSLRFDVAFENNPLVKYYTIGGFHFKTRPNFLKDLEPVERRAVVRHLSAATICQHNFFCI